MEMKEKKAYLRKIYIRYHQANKITKKSILDEYCAICNYNRKYAIRLLQKPLNPPKAKTGPKPTYNPERLLKHLKALWFAADQPCASKLKAIIPKWIKYYTLEHYLCERDKKQILAMSSATINRMLKPVRLVNKRHGMCATKPGTILKNRIEIKTHNWDVTKPGFVEADTVALCGNSLAGDFVWCINLTDVMSGWTEVRAIWNKGAAGVLEQIENIEKSLAFSLLGFDSDNGTEFMNHHLLRYLEERDQPVKFTRSRPYRKNDNAHIEQKNYTHVRHLFGYDRFDNFNLVTMMNDLLANEWSQYQNHFIPTAKLVNKTRINSKYKKKYDSPQTPYARLMASNYVTNEDKIKLAAQHNKLNPFILKRQIESKLAAVFSLVMVTSNGRQRI